MPTVEACLLGIVQGLTEFLPISSSAHLTLIPQLLGWENDLLNSLAFEVALHTGTLAAVILFFRRECAEILMAFLRGMVHPSQFHDPRARLGAFIIIGTLPAVAVALWAGDWIEGVFRQPWRVAVCLIGFSFVMIWAERMARQQRELSELGAWDAGLIGCAQALSLMPGISRSGATITAGLMLHLRREEAARFAFLLSMPAIAGALVLHIRPLLKYTQGPSWWPLILGTLAAALSGYFCIKFLLVYLRRHTLYVFVIYRLALGAAVLLWLALHPASSL